MNTDECLKWARSLPVYERTVQQLVTEAGVPEEAARLLTDLTILAQTRVGRRALCAEEAGR